MRIRFFRVSSLLIIICAAMFSRAEDSTCGATPCACECSCGYDEGLQATVNGFLSVKNVCVPGQCAGFLCVPGFCSSLPVYTVIQDHAAPLVVVLLGIAGKASTDYGKLWARYYAQAGYHVLTFDSTFRPEFNVNTGRGISGNIWGESEEVRDIIAAFLATKRAEVTKIGVVGMSYGGVEALILGKLQAQGKLPFKIDAIQAYSPPIDMRETAVILDDWYNEDRFKYTLVELYLKVARYNPNCGEHLCPSLMRAGISVAFQLELGPLIIAEDHKYCIHQLEAQGALEKKEEAALWGFTRYEHEFALPFWRDRLGSNVIDELIGQTRLGTLLQGQPPCTQTIFAADDPFNTPADLHEIELAAAKLPLTILPHGGHLGYVCDEATKVRLLALFEPEKK